MNIAQTLKDERRELVRKIELQYARFASIPATYPDFMCIGAPRAATTWLFTQLRADPRIFLPKLKELHFFDEDEGGPAEHDSSGLQWRRRFYFDMSNPIHFRWYWLQFKRGIGAVKGDITPLYSLLSAERVRLIHEKIPGLRVIYILRNPIDRAWSGLRKSAWYQKGTNHMAAQSLEWLEKTIMHPAVLERGNYRRVLETWESHFPRDQMLILFHDDIVLDPGAELGKVYAFLGLPRPAAMSPSDAEGRVNAAPELPMPAPIRARLEAYYRDDVRFLERRFGRDLGHWVS